MPQRDTSSVSHPTPSTAAAWSCRVASLLALAALCWSLPSHADKPEWAGGKKDSREWEHRERQGTRADGHEWQRSAPVGGHPGPLVEIRIGGYFGDRQRLVVHQDHQRMIRAGHCPPGLAKKGNGCMPPGQAQKAYRVGRPLPPGVVYYDLPPTLSVQLGPAPAGHRFVRVAADILLIAVGTGMVIDAIEDLGR